MGNLSHDALQEILDEAHSQVQVGSLYAHYRMPGTPYKVLAIAINEADERPCVVYEAQDGSGLVWTRDLADWLSYVDGDQGDRVPRFSPFGA